MANMMTQQARSYRRASMAFNVHENVMNYPSRSNLGNRYRLTKNMTTHSKWFRVTWHRSMAPYGMQWHEDTPRMLLDRDFYKMPSLAISMTKQNDLTLPYLSRWERSMESKRVTEDRWHLVEEEGEMIKVNYRLYCERMNAEIKATRDALPQLTLVMKGIPHSWKKMDIACALVHGCSIREAMAQCKFGWRKGHAVLYRALEKVLQGAETKGLDKDKLRVTRTHVTQGSRDKQIDIRSRGYYSWKTKRSSNLVLTVTEDPDMVLPDRSTIPYRSQVALRSAGIATEATALDIPAITAEGI